MGLTKLRVEFTLYRHRRFHRGRKECMKASEGAPLRVEYLGALSNDKP